MSEKSIPTEKLSLLLTAQDASFIYGEPRNGPLHIGSLSFFKDQIPNSRVQHPTVSNPF